MSSIDISIIICTHNRATMLADVLNSIERLEIPESAGIELVVVDNASSDNTFQVIKEHETRSKFKVRALEESRQGKTFALNTGITGAAGELLTFIDDDHIVSANYLKAIHAAAEKYPTVNIFCGRIVPDWDGTEPAWVHDDTRYPIRPFPIPNFNLGDTVLEVQPDRMFIPGAGNLAIRKKVFNEVGLFNESIGPKGHNLQGGEDVEFIMRAFRQGEHLLYIPEILQYHQVEKDKLTLQYLIRKAYYRTKAACQMNTAISSGSIPLYKYRLMITYFVKSLFTLEHAARRYYLVKLASIMGEMSGHKIRSLHE